ncbi:hypothetical protein [Streptomyces triticisoli]|uniref:hypothetical protein n=1 Tax=Streptomyces triticisoli TaxID=2182797 RepID=UPI001E3CBED2|nr:hypothetical protein [Streptomyces triticisoli]
MSRCVLSALDPRMVAAPVRALDRHGWHPAVTAEDGVSVSPPVPPAADREEVRR